MDPVIEANREYYVRNRDRQCDLRMARYHARRRQAVEAEGLEYVPRHRRTPRLIARERAVAESGKIDEWVAHVNGLTYKPKPKPIPKKTEQDITENMAALSIT